jgi:hypothetical protein
VVKIADSLVITNYGGGYRNLFENGDGYGFGVEFDGFDGDGLGYGGQESSCWGYGNGYGLIGGDGRGGWDWGEDGSPSDW